MPDAQKVMPAIQKKMDYGQKEMVGVLDSDVAPGIAFAECTGSVGSRCHPTTAAGCTKIGTVETDLDPYVSGVYDAAKRVRRDQGIESGDILIA